MNTVATLHVLLHFALTRDTPEDFSLDHHEALRALVHEGLLTPVPKTEDEYLLTSLGHAWVQEICHTPIPALQYVGASGKVYKA